MTYKEKYDSEQDWYKKVLLTSMYHLAMNHRNKGKWTIQDTANYFGCSSGLISENLKIADCIQTDEHNLMKIKTRREALRYLEVRHG